MVRAAREREDASLRVGVVGVGVMGSNHARVLTDLPGVHFVGVADPDHQQAAFVANALAICVVAALHIRGAASITRPVTSSQNNRT